MTYSPDLFTPRYRVLFGARGKPLRLTQSQVDGIDYLLARTGADERLADVRMAAYVWATVWWEAARRFQPISEFAPRGVDPVAYFNRKYSHRSDIGNNGGDSGWLFRGRGYCQITGLANYRKFSEILSLDLLANPDLALLPEHAYEIMVYGMTNGTFTGKRLSQYIRGTTKNYLFARQIINRMDQAPVIARAADRFERLLTEARI